LFSLGEVEIETANTFGWKSTQIQLLTLWI